MQSGGVMSVPVDSRTGQVYRPTLQGTAGSPLSTFERYFDFFIDNVPDPDTALAMNPAFDELMRQQPDAHAAFLIREQTVAQYDWTINPADGDGIPGFDVALAAQVANYAKSVFNGLDMTALHEEMQQAISLGGAGHEFIWQPGIDGVERPKRFIYIHKSNYVFDRLGNQALLTRGTPVWGSYSSANTSQPPAPVKFSDGRYASYFPDGKFIYHRYQALGGSWTRPAEAGYQYWGRGEDTRIYILVTAAQAVLRFWLKFLERWGVPPTDVYFPDNLRPSAEVQAIVSDAINGATNAIPRQIGQPYDSMYHIETRNPPGGSNEYFFTFLDRYVAPKIRMIILGSADEQQNSGASGGYSDHVSRKESGSGVVFRRDGLRISETLNRQLMPHVVLRKFRGLPAMYWPKHSLLAEEERDRKQEIEIAQIVSTLVPIKEDEIYERSGFSKPEDGDKIVFNKQGPGMDDPFAAAMAGGEPPEGLRGPGPASEGGTPNAATGQGDDAGGGAIAQGGGAFSRGSVGERGNSMQATFAAGFDEAEHPRATDGKFTSAQAAEYLENDQVPDGWYIHGRAGRKELKTGHAIQMTKRADVAKQYAGKKGSVHYIRPTSKANILDFNDPSIREKVVDRYLKDVESGLGPVGSDELIERVGLEKAREKLLDEINPKDIVDSAGLFDDSAFNYWLWERFEPDFAITNDGAIALNVEDANSTDRVMVEPKKKVNRGDSEKANFSAGFEESEHPRGQPDNPGQFAPPRPGGRPDRG